MVIFHSYVSLPEAIWNSIWYIDFLPPILPWFLQCQAAARLIRTEPGRPESFAIPARVREAHGHGPCRAGGAGDDGRGGWIGMD